VCVVGAGPAGLVVALELASRGARVLVVEAGDRGGDPRGDEDLMRGTALGDPYGELHRIRAQGVGGTARIWAAAVGDGEALARFVPLDPIDFEQREQMPHSGWPLARADLDPFYERARDVLRLRAPDGSATTPSPATARPLPLHPERVETITTHYAPARIFTAELPARLAEQPLVRLRPETAVVDIEADAAGARVTGVRAVGRDGAEVRIRARAVVLAAGAIENARLLLLAGSGARGFRPGGDLVGRFLMDHPRIRAGRLVPRDSGLPSRLAAYDLSVDGPLPTQSALRIPFDVMRSEGLGNGVFFLRLHRRGFGSPAFAAIRGLRVGERPRVRHALAIARGLDDIAARAAQTLRPPHARERPPEFGWSVWPRAHQLRTIEVLQQTEQSPDPDNRVALGEDRDRLGRRRPSVTWRWREPDRRRVARAQELLAQELPRAGLGALEIRRVDGEPEIHQASIHHPMGTTRMHRDPGGGVVDEHCRVHGVANLFVAGSSVFPTGGFANPTLTILALSIRLADRLLSALRTLPETG
jgi:choline dehydrogenase-like flavoprotein